MTADIVAAYSNLGIITQQFALINLLIHSHRESTINIGKAMLWLQERTR